MLLLFLYKLPRNIELAKVKQTNLNIFERIYCFLLVNEFKELKLSKVVS